MCQTYLGSRCRVVSIDRRTAPDPHNPRDPGSFGPKLYCLSGHVEKPGCYEAPLGITVQQLVDQFGGGVWKGRQAKAAIPGGISMGVLGRDEFGLPPGLSRPWHLRLFGARNRGRGCSGRDRLDGRFSSQQCPLLCPRELRAVHAVSGGYSVGAETSGSNQGWTGKVDRFGAASRNW